MRIPTRARYALRLMVDLADHQRPGTWVVLKDVADRQGISKRYLEQLAVILKQADLLVSTSGRGGGYQLRHNPAQIRLSDVMQAMLGTINVADCVQDQGRCQVAGSCPSRRVFCELNGEINRVLASYTLADLAQHPACFHTGLAEPCGLSSAEPHDVARATSAQNPLEV